jgi:hypothetical protein
MEACPSIFRNGFKTGIKGIIGSGMYFAEKSVETGRKTRHYGCMIEVLVRLGRIYDAGEGYNTNPPDGGRLLQMGYDAVTVVDTSNEHFGREFEIYHKDQIVDMTAYPCDGRWTHCENERLQYKCKGPPSGVRTGPNLFRKDSFYLDKLACDANDYRAQPLAEDSFAEPPEDVAV